MQQFPPHTILCTSYAKRRKICVPSKKKGRNASMEDGTGKYNGILIREIG